MGGGNLDGDLINCCVSILQIVEIQQAKCISNSLDYFASTHRISGKVDMPQPTASRATEAHTIHGHAISSLPFLQFIPPNPPSTIDIPKRKWIDSNGASDGHSIIRNHSKYVHYYDSLLQANKTRSSQETLETQIPLKYPKTMYLFKQNFVHPFCNKRAVPTASIW